MSKVKPDLDIPKRKLKRSLRRHESAKKKADRMMNAKAGVYSYGEGYYILKRRAIGVYTEVTIPETKKWFGHYERQMKTFYDSEGEPYTIPIMVFIKDELRTIPEKTVRRRVTHEFVDVSPRPVRINTTKRDWKKCSQRVLRRAHKLEHFKGGAYKRVYDVSWACLW